MTDVRTGRGPLLVMALGWLAVVVAVAAVTFLVVDRAGRGVGRASAAETVAALPTPPTRPTSAAPSPTAQDTASFTSDGGTVVASCEDGVVQLVSLRPRDGWRFDKETEHGRLEVVFRGDSRQVELLLTCVRGVPTSTREE